MKIALLHRDLPPQSYAGVAIQVHRLAQTLVHLGHQVTVFSLTSEPKKAGYSVVQIDFSGLAFVQRHFKPALRILFPIACRFLDFKKFDVIHVHGDGGWLKYDFRYVRTFHGTAALEAKYAKHLSAKISQWFSYALERREANQCRNLTTVGRHVSQYLPNITNLIPNMIPFGPDPFSLQAKALKPTLIFLGSKGGRKRGELALQLQRELSSKFVDLQFHYVGPARDAQGYEQKTNPPGLHFHTHLTEEELFHLYRQSWIYVCFSSYEGFGVPWAEAMSQGCCVVTTPHEGAQEWLHPNEDALVDHAENLFSRVVDLIQNPQKRNDLAQAGLRIAQQFTPEKVVQKYLEVYTQATRLT